MVELLNKVAPLFILYIAQKRLGLEGLSYALFGIATVDFIMPFITCGYTMYGIVHFNASDDQKSLVNHINGIRMVHAVVAFLAVVLLCMLEPSYRPYLPLVVGLSFLFFLAAIDSIWVHIAVQKMPQVSFLIAVGKLISLSAILLLVIDKQDEVLFAMLYLSGNGFVALMTFFYVSRRFGLCLPTFKGLGHIFVKAQHFAIIVLLINFIDRLDILIAERIFGVVNSGLYTGPHRIAQSLAQVSGAIVMAFFSEIVAVKTQEEFTSHVKLGLLVLLSFFSPIVFGVFFVDQDVIGFILGEQFAAAAPLLSVQTIGIMFASLGLALGQHVLLLKQQVKLYAIALVLGIGTLLLCSVWVSFSQNIIHMAYAMVAAKLVTCCGVIIFSKRFLGPISLGWMLKAVLPGFLMFLCLWLLKLEGFFVHVLIGGGVYGVFASVVHFREVKQLYRRVRVRG